MKKLSTLVLATMLVFSNAPCAVALPTDTVLIGNQAFSLDLFFQPDLPEAVIFALGDGGDIYYDLGTGFTDAWSGDPMPETVQSGLEDITYMNSDGSTSVYANFTDTQPINTKMASGKVEVASIGSAKVARIYIDSSEIGSQFRLPDGVATSFANYVQIDSTSIQTTLVELLDSTGNVLGTISVSLTAGSFDVEIQEATTDFEVVDIT